MSNIYDAQVATRNPAWYMVGSRMSQVEGAGGMTAAQVAHAAGLDNWNVRTEAMFTASGIEVPNRVATVRSKRDGGTEYLGYVGRQYRIQQNEETFNFLDNLVDVSGAHYDTAGYFGRGHKVFMTMKMPEGIQIGGEDAHDVYLLATNGHDGFTPFTVGVVPIRLMCTNQLSHALKGAKQMWKIRHTTHMDGRVDEARESLRLTFDYMDAFTAEMEMLLDQQYTNRQFEKLTKALFPDSKTEGGQAKVADKRSTLMHLFTEAATQEFGRGTKYAAYNAVTEYADWYRPVRGDADGSKRAMHTLTSSTVQDFKDFALASLTSSR